MLRGGGNKNAVIDDLNAIRVRAGLNCLPYTLTDQQVTDAIVTQKAHRVVCRMGTSLAGSEKDEQGHAGAFGDILQTNRG